MLPYDAMEPDIDRLGPLLNSLIPNRGPLAGGSEILIIGRDFNEDVQIFLGARPCADIRLESENHLRCVTPAGEHSGPVDLRILLEGEEARLEEGFHYFEPLNVLNMLPLKGPTAGGIEISIEGEGLLESSTVLFGGRAALRVRWDEEVGILSCLLPSGEPGIVDVLIRNINGELRLPQAFSYYEEIFLEALQPQWGWSTGGEEISLSGAGLLLESQVRFGDAEAEPLQSELERQRLKVLSPPHEPGLVTVAVENINGLVQREQAFLYLDPEEEELSLEAVVPQRLPSSGGGRILVGGSGFTEEVQIFLDGERIFCELEEPHRLSCVAPIHPPGWVEIQLRQGEEQRSLPRGLRYFPEIEVFDLQPGRGALSGGTLVEISGRGFHEEMVLELAGARLDLIEVPDAEHAWARTPKGRMGFAHFRAYTQEDEAWLPEAFEYFDPYSRFGGIWGEAILHSVNVTLVNSMDGSRIADAQVWARSPGGSMRIGFSDEEGQIVLSSLELEPPVSVTAAKVGFEVSTYERVTHQNVTLFMDPHPSEIEPEPGDPPEPPPPLENAQIEGELWGLAELIKPTEPGYVLAAFVETTHSSIFNRNALPWPEERGVLLEDGAFSITARPGELAVIATAAHVPHGSLVDYQEDLISYQSLRALSFPVAMAYQRFVSASPGRQISGIELRLEHPLDQQLMVELDNPSGGTVEGPGLYEVRVFLDFGSEGYWQLEPGSQGPNHRLPVGSLPDISTWDPDLSLLWQGIARNDGPLWQPYTITFEHSRDFGESLSIGPFIGTPRIIHPQDGGALGDDRLIRWTTFPGISGPTETPHIQLLNISSSTGIALWSHLLPGGVDQYTLPDLPFELGEADAGLYLSFSSVRVDGEFNYDDFAFRDLYLERRKSFSVTSLRFDYVESPEDL